MNTTFSYDRYWRFEELTANLKVLAEQYPELSKLESLAKTPEGRDIWAMTITDPSTGPAAGKPAFYVDGSHHAGEVTGSMSAAYFADFLLTNSGTSRVGKLLRDYTFYVLPRVSPDGAEYYLTTPDRVRSVNRPYPCEQPLPGLRAADMDGDGVIRSMRVKSPYGMWKVSPIDPRLMVQRKPDETEGEFYNVYPEGYIEGYDGLDIKEAPSPYGSDFNRNYPIAWAPESGQKGAGIYPLSNIETRTVADFIIGHKNIGSVITFHTWGGMFLFPPGFIPSKKADPEDMARYHEIGKIATEETGYPVVNLFDEYTPEGEDISSGAMDDWCHFDRGIPAYTIECWDLKPRAGIPLVWPQPASLTPDEQAEEMAKLMKWNDENLDGEGFSGWTPAVHPQLGFVEYGGFDYKFMFQNAPPKFLRQEAEKHTRYILRAATLLPKVTVDRVDARKLGEGVYEVTAVVGNLGYLPTYLTKEALKLGVDSPVKVCVSLPAEGGSTREIGHLQGRSNVQTSFGAFGFSTRSEQQRAVKWIVRAEAGSRYTVRVESKTGGCAEMTKTLA